MNTYARTWIFMFGLLMAFCGLFYGAFWSADAVMVDMERQGYTQTCGSAFWENENAHVGDRFDDAYYNRNGPEVNARKNAEQQQRCDTARAANGRTTRNIIAFGAFCIFFAFLHNPFKKRNSGKVDFEEIDRVTRQAQTEVDVRKKDRAARRAEFRAEYNRRVQPTINRTEKES